MVHMHSGPVLQDSVIPVPHRALSSLTAAGALASSAESLSPATRAALPACITAFFICLQHRLGCTRAALAAGDGKDLQIDPATLDRVTKAMLSRTEVVLLTNADRREAR